jgi:signal transduction histidine kinase
VSVAEPPGRAQEEFAVPRGAALVALDTAAAAVLGTLMILSALSPTRNHLFGEPAWLRVMVGVLSVTALCLRRLLQLSALAIAFATSTAAWLMGFERDSFLTVALVLYIISSTRPPSRSGPLLLLAGTVTAVAYTLFAFPIPGGGHVPWFQSLALSSTSVAIEAVGWALGLAVYRQRSYVQAVRVQATQEVRAQRELAARAAAEERLRIARELHDVVAHAMSVITVQAGVARFILPEHPEQTSAALEVIESTGRQALRDMRQLLGVLRQEGDQSPRTPMPALSDLGELVEGTRAAGTEVELKIRGSARPLPEGLEVSAYRIVQEALTNVVKHAGSRRAQVVLGYEPRELTITVLDDGPGGLGGVSAGGGHGLVGMRERAALHGGSVEAGPLPVRGYRVAARLPVPASGERAAA